MGLALTGDDLRLVDLEVTSLQARQTRGESHVRWSVGYAPEPEPETPGRVVFAQLHAYGEKGGGDVGVATIVLYPPSANPTTEQFLEALTESDALETLYDYARTILRGLIGIVDASFEIDRLAPPATFEALTRAASDEEPSAEMSVTQDQSD